MHFNQVFLITASVVGSLALPSSLRSDQHTSGSATSKGTSSSQRWFLPAEWHLPGAVTAAALATAGVVTALQESQSKANLPTEDGRGGTARGGDTATVQEGMRRSTEEMTRRPISEGSSENLRQLDLAQRILDIARDDPHGHDWIFRCAKIHSSNGAPEPYSANLKRCYEKYVHLKAKLGGARVPWPVEEGAGSGSTASQPDDDDGRVNRFQSSDQEPARSRSSLSHLSLPKPNLAGFATRVVKSARPGFLRVPKLSMAVL